MLMYEVIATLNIADMSCFLKWNLGKYLRKKNSEIHIFTLKKKGISQKKMVRQCIKQSPLGQKLVSLTNKNRET